MLIYCHLGCYYGKTMYAIITTDGRKRVNSNLSKTNNKKGFFLSINATFLSDACFYDPCSIFSLHFSATFSETYSEMIKQG